MKTASIISRTTGVGLDRDSRLLADALAHLGIRAEHFRPNHVVHALLRRGRIRHYFHLERMYPLWRYVPGVHFLIPNQERYPRRLVGRLKGVDTVLCKSRHACDIFSQLHPDTRYLGFTSEDHLAVDAVTDYGRFFHLAGKSTLKNTSCVLGLWREHPEWPPLTLVQHPRNAPKTVPSNVRLIADHLPDTELCRLQGECGIHLCPSLSEGWGHYIAEAMSCRAVTVVTDAPPMNELVQCTRGVTVSYYRTEPRHLGTNYFVDPALLGQTVERLIRMPHQDRERLGNAARQWFEKNHQAFLRNLSAVLCPTKQ